MLSALGISCRQLPGDLFAVEIESGAARRRHGVRTSRGGGKSSGAQEGGDRQDVPRQIGDRSAAAKHPHVWV
jgi:hypothetical protein